MSGNHTDSHSVVHPLCTARTQRRAATASLTALFAVCAAVLGCAAELENPTRFQGASTTGGSGGSANGGAGAGPAAGNGGAPVGNGGSSGAPATVAPQDPPCWTALKGLQCSSICHKPGVGVSLSANLDLTKSGADLSKMMASYVTITDAAERAKCKPGALIIDPVRPSESVLLKKVKGTQDCGTPMPFAPGLGVEDLKCVEDWIKSFNPTAANRLELDAHASPEGSP
ncbi:MAG TPA: hypothetical protein VER33_11325 [Polyangiaceae bacterium]|nr:hypothetical protein [Polyangiaceae bacterium]